MAIEKDQRTAFNDALKEVEKSNKELLKLYQNALDEATKELAVFKLQIDQGKLSDTQVTMKQKRIEKLIQELNDQIDKLYFVQGDIITSGWTQNYVSTYYQIGFAIEKEINLVTLPEMGATYNYSINYRKINPAYAKSQLNNIIGGFTFSDRQGINKAMMQAQLRDIINNAVIQGLTPKQVAKELGKLDDVYSQNLNKAIATARTELLRAYSVSQEESIAIAEDRGIEGENIWDATLDGRTRPQHAKMDQKKTGVDGYFTMPNGERTLGPRMPGLSAGNSVNCRCRKVFLPEGVKPNTRGFRTASGDWKQTYGGMTWEEWSKTLEGQATIEQTKIEKREMAKRKAQK